MKVKEERWELSPETITAYQEITDQIFIPESAVRDMLDDQTSDIVRQYAAGTMDLHSFMDAMVRKARLMQLE
ncbi:MAG: hypothetical protein RR379_03350 [Clostridia bacterium]